MVRIRRLSLSLLLTACGDDVAGSATTGGSASATGDTTDVSVGQTSAPEPGTGVTPTTGGPDPTGGPDTSTSTTSTSTTGAPDTGEPVECTKIEFDDPGLEIQVQEFLAIKGEVPLEVALATEELRLFADWQIDGLGGLECFVNLRVFESDSAGIIDDLTPLAHLTKLERLMLPSSWVVDLSPLTGLAALTSLDLRVTKLADLGPLHELALVDLSLGRSMLADFTSLAGHPTLTRLTARGLTGTGITGLAQLPKLERLSVTDSELTDIGALAGAPALRELDLADNQITSLAPLAGLTTLVELHAANNKISSLPAPAGLGELAILDLGKNQITDPTPLGQLPSLRELTLDDNPLTKGITGLAALTKLERLQVSRTSISKLAAIAPATLVHIGAEDNKIVDLTPLAEHAALADLRFARNAIVSVHPIVAAPFWSADPCVRANFRENPLDAESLDVDLPALCAGGDALEFADQICADCIPMP